MAAYSIFSLDHLSAPSDFCFVMKVLVGTVKDIGVDYACR